MANLFFFRWITDTVVSWDTRDQQFKDLGINGEFYHNVETHNRKTVVP